MTPAQAKATFLRLWKSKGETIRLVKYDFDGSETSCTVRAVILAAPRSDMTEELTGGVTSTDRRVMVFADDINAAYGAVSDGDMAVIREGTVEERSLFVRDPDTSTHRLNGGLVAVAFRAAGGA